MIRYTNKQGNNMQLTKQQLNEIQRASVCIQNKLATRLETETDKQSREWTAMQLGYQKSVYKAAMHAQGGGVVVNGVKPCSAEELVEYYNAVCKEVA